MKNSVQHRLRVTMAENNIFQIQSLENPNLCMEVFKTLENFGRLWLRQCKTKGDRGIKRQMFSVTNDGKLHSSTKSSSCIFLYSNKNLRYRKDCVGILHTEKNQFMFDFFDGIIFLMGDVTKVMAVRELEEKKEVKLQKGPPSKITKQRWALHFERDRVLQPGDDDDDEVIQDDEVSSTIFACNQTSKPTMSSGKYPPSSKPPHTLTKTPMPSAGKHPSSPTSTQTPTKGLISKWNPPTTYQRISTRWDFNSYVYIWLNNNMNGEHVSDAEKDVYHDLVEKYG